jgi:hypothetical protein
MQIYIIAFVRDFAACRLISPGILIFSTDFHIKVFQNDSIISDIKLYFYNGIPAFKQLKYRYQYHTVHFYVVIHFCGSLWSF